MLCENYSHQGFDFLLFVVIKTPSQSSPDILLSEKCKTQNNA